MGAHEGAVAIVTGASRGIGLGIAARLVAEGAKVVITARKPEPLAEAVASLGGSAHAVGIAGNAADGDHQDEVIAAARSTFGGLHYLVNNTGINPVYGPMLDADVDVARKVLDVNVVAAFSWIKKAVASGLGDEAHPGAVVNLASIAGQGASGVIGWYGVSKAALIHLTTELGYQLGPDVRVNAVAPAVVKTRFAEALYEGREEKVSRAYPMKRLGTPEDIAGAVSFLLGPDSAWITGQTLTIDGGVTLGGVF
ncbi:SDR family oxidoreductase [Intrasporangium calvum]|uniref:Short-chain dehydrogenase/reductase SDR n=1 Tax=Intrasporangium calvum (strain ATCC 23552 / DSM 43043 / JCM 3097 / NBRC 12989 / NCIMB 10167 / NRRL B-3866 / 7 KIP) TaxID=710696 RepID=E6S6B3_INTC7|nr:SDR family oxidoreductase [Intrasporangium calvum]ADU47864.1 short-chain dehydrogenase/reductase SDR [Intrasporangium calvum DSM 43043]